MLIGLHDADRDHMPKKTFPNYALMKISTYHKIKGDEVEWWLPFKKYDRVYSSKVFDFTPENPYLPVGTIKGGTGYGLYNKLDEIVNPSHKDNICLEPLFPDYSIYPDCDYAIGFLTRGCPNSCRWCIVPQKEGNIKQYMMIRQVARPDTNKIVLLDNNILACQWGIDMLKQFTYEPYRIDLNQGMDARLANDDTIIGFNNETIIDILATIKWTHYIRFSCDSDSQIEPLIKVAEKLKARGVKTSKIFVYLLVTADIENAENRVSELTRHIPQVTIYAQAEINPSQGIMPNKIQKEFTRYSLFRAYRYMSFSKWYPQYASNPNIAICT